MIKKLCGMMFVVAFLLGVCASGWSFDPMNPTSFDHQVRKQSYNSYPKLKIKLAIARVHDTQVLETPFGKKVGGVEVVGTDGTSTSVIKSKERYDTRKDEYGYGKIIRETLSYNLARLKWIQLVEREDINDIIRNWDFGDSKYVRKDSKAPMIELPKIIAKGFMTSNEGSCGDEDTEAAAWGVEKKEKDQNRLMFLLRLYATDTSYVKYIACGTGNTQADAVKSAVDDLKEHRDLLFPTVRVTSVKGKSVELDGGTDKGLARGTKFYLIRTDDEKEELDLDSLDYVAFCKVTRADTSSSLAIIKESMSNLMPEEGDMVFYYFPEEEW
jgi:hypothetical protein